MKNRPANRRPSDILARRRATAALLALLLAAIAPAPPLLGITDEEIYGAFRFPLSLPGARPAAMGGAGLALAEDATASRVNPARLGSIRDPELIFEGRMQDVDTMSGGSGHVILDRAVHPFAGTSTFSSTSPQDPGTASYVGLAWPIDLKRPLVVSIARAEALDTVIDVRSLTRTIPPTVPQTPGAGDEVVRINRGHLDMDLELYYVGAGWRLTPTFSLGGSIVAGRMSLSSESIGLLSDPLQLTDPSMFDPRFSGRQAEPLYLTTSGGADTAPGFVFGSYWRPAPSLALATVYRRGPRFEVPGRSRDLFTGRRENFHNVVKVPDTAAVGVCWTPLLNHPSEMAQSLTFAIDVERVEHSDLLDGMREGEGILTRPDVARKTSYDIDDALEARLGVEARRSFPAWTLAMRGGVHVTPDRRLHLEGIRDEPTSPLQGQGKALEEGGFLLPDDGNIWHFTLGAGARFQTISYDLAVDMSESDTQVLVTGGWRFRRR